MLKDQLTEDLKAAMRAKDAVRLRTIRALLTAMKEAEIAQREGGVAELDEKQATAVVQKQAKQRRDALTQYEQAGREDLAAKEREELEVLDAYLPKQLTDDDLRSVLHEVIAATDATGPADMGKVMGLAMKKVAGRADGRRVQAFVRDFLAGKA